MLHNALTRYTSSGGIRRYLPLQGKAKSGRAARLAEQTRFAPNTETFSSVYPISVTYRSRLARSPGGLGGRSRIEPRISTKSLFAGATRGSLAAQSPECAFLPRRSLHKQRMPENSGDAVGKTLSKPEPDRQVASSPFRKLPDTIFHGTLMGKTADDKKKNP